MAAYDYCCRVCDATFEVNRSISAPETQVACPAGHAEVSRVWSAVALAGVGSGSPQASMAAPATSGGGCCGGGCCG